MNQRQSLGGHGRRGGKQPLPDRRITLTPAKDDDNREHIQPLLKFWDRLCKELHLRSLDTTMSKCFYYAYVNVQCTLQSLVSLTNTCKKVLAFMSESLIPMEENSPETLQMLLQVRDQMKNIIIEAREYL